MPKLTFVSFIPPLIPAKSPNEVKEISKFFKKIKKLTTKKLYVQASTPKPHSSDKFSNIVMNTLKIKETFPNLSNNKIDSIQKVINGSNDKAKLRLNMTTKGPSCKQVIIPMSYNLGKRFIKDSSSHIININWALKSIKSNICADFICADNKASSYQQTMWLQIPISRRLKNMLRCPLLQIMRAFPPPDFLSLSPISKSWVSHTLLTNPTFISLLKILNASSRTIISLMISSSHQNHALSRSLLNRTWLLSGLTYGVPKTVTMLRKLLTGASI